MRRLTVAALFLALVASGCSGSDAELDGTWLITSVQIEGVEELGGGDARFPIHFGEDGIFEMEAACNRHRGEYSVEGQTLFIEEVIMQAALCSDSRMALDRTLGAVFTESAAAVEFRDDDATAVLSNEAAVVRMIRAGSSTDALTPSRG